LPTSRTQTTTRNDPASHQSKTPPLEVAPRKRLSVCRFISSQILILREVVIPIDYLLLINYEHSMEFSSEEVEVEQPEKIEEEGHGLPRVFR
jgi:hypothetical protein